MGKDKKDEMIKYGMKIIVDENGEKWMIVDGERYKMMNGGFYFVELPSKRMSRSVNKSESTPPKMSRYVTLFSRYFYSLIIG